jgi:CxxC motif-containing protein (DUF1111 family)
MGIGLSSALVLLGTTVAFQANAQAQRERFRISGQIQDETPAADARTPRPAPRLTEALAGFDNLTNGFLPQGPDYATLDERGVVPLRSFNDDRFLFEEVEAMDDGLGPIYNAQSCRECHQNVATGGASQVAEHRTGRMQNGAFFESQGGSLIGSRTTYPDLQERVAFEDSIRTFRISTNTLGAGYVEAIANTTLLAIRLAQPASMRGSIVLAPELEANSVPRIGRFGWKSQHASLESFAADAYLNEMGITSPLFPEENTASGVSVAYPSHYDPVPEPEDDGMDVKAFADFMRSTKAPSRGEITADVLAGETIFKSVGCATCHVPTLPTSPPGTPINGGKLVVPEALGNKLIHPYSDFLLHDIGTGDGIPVQPTPELASTASQIRTAPLWALRTRNRLMHDGLTFTEREAIMRHAGQAAPVTQRFRALSAADQALLLAFLDSL